MSRLVLAVAIAAAVLCFQATSSHAGYLGDAPWCAVIEIGAGDVEWDCEYRTVEECVPNVLAGNRGFCELNPYGPPARTVPPARIRRHPRHPRHWH
jgi:hypothetical protein